MTEDTTSILQDNQVGDQCVRLRPEAGQRHQHQRLITPRQALPNWIVTARTCEAAFLESSGLRGPSLAGCRLAEGTSGGG